MAEAMEEIIRNINPVILTFIALFVKSQTMNQEIAYLDAPNVKSLAILREIVGSKIKRERMRQIL